jgi:hypothetical protein
MSHHYQDPEMKNDELPVEPITAEYSHPFLEKNDLTFLAMVKPLLSYKGQKLIGFFLDFGNPEDAKGNQLDFSEVLKQFASKNDSVKELIPLLMGLAKGSDDKPSLNPAMLSALLTLLNNKTKKE